MQSFFANLLLNRPSLLQGRIKPQSHIVAVLYFMSKAVSLYALSWILMIPRFDDKYKLQRHFLIYYLHKNIASIYLTIVIQVIVYNGFFDKMQMC